MRSVLISLSPYWYYLIAERIKTLEIRKTVPMAPDWNRICECYMTMDLRSLRMIPDKNRDKYRNLMGKVGMWIVCDTTYMLAPINKEPKEAVAEKESCLTREQIVYYLKGNGYGWHISEQHTYGEPRKLSDYKGLCRVEYDCCACPYYSYTEMQCERRIIRRPPQSWMYVEEN